MDKQVIKILLLSILSMFYSNIIICQIKQIPSPLRIVSNIPRDCYHVGDTICFTVKNVTNANRGYTLEAICMTGPETKRYFNREIYTAYFNNDTTFFTSSKKRKQISEEKTKIGYLMPTATANPYDIAADSSSTFVFILKGKRIKNGIKIKFRIIPDIVEGEPEYVIETKPFLLFVTP